MYPLVGAALFLIVSTKFGDNRVKHLEAVNWRTGTTLMFKGYPLVLHQ